ncbi:TIGR01777 family oxidoreductase [Mucilaginibacter sp. 44-25]|uniref:TIGR01777 family oxidoreductase n=1 Tax=Mucilaginibacter sp. 44-25 TaxID=1895794 RepID=UPI0009696831|nr:TIGR01777 family oxidoreductase [Mucilaginibacter sp. 44-25]OJW13818.1 MAG: TIGR01777 family protein [Mucilaginibacter sp. 44-25]
MSAKNILITGGSGLLGKQLTHELLNKGYNVSHLSRKPNPNNTRVKTFVWDVNKGEIDPACIDGVDTIIHLAGAGIADKRWTDKRKKEITDSRTKSITLVYSLLRDNPHRVKAVISASGINYYGDCGDRILNEDTPPANDFIGNCCVDWENAVDQGTEFGLRIVKFRTGVVLDKKGGALPKLAIPVKLGIGSALGNGKQWVPWIHTRDVIGMYIFALENERLAGVFNMVSPLPVTNLQLTRSVAAQLKRPLWAPKVPAFLIKLLFGEMASLVLGSVRASALKIENEGYQFKYADIGSALKEIYG